MNISSPELQPLPPNNRTAAAVLAIENYIIHHQLAPGDPLPTEHALCEELQVSRSAVREAIGQLQALNVVKVRHGRGTFVGDLSLEPIIKILLLRAQLATESQQTLREVLEVRRIIDRGCAAIIVDALSGRSHSGLRAQVDTMAAHAQRGETFLEADIAFHQGLYRYTPALLTQLASALWEIHMRSLRSLQLPIGDLKATAAAHAHMLDAAEAGDLNGYLTAIDEHYAPLRQALGGAA